MSRSPFFPGLFAFAFVGIALIGFRFSPKAAVATQPEAQFIEFLVPAAALPASPDLRTVIFLDDSQPNTAAPGPPGGGASVQCAYALRKVPRTNGGLVGSVTDVLPTQKVPPGTRLGTIVGGDLVVIGSGAGYGRYWRYVGTIL